MSNEGEGTGRSGLSRRTMVTAAAWSVPAVALATAAPAAAASPPTTGLAVAFTKVVYDYLPNASSNEAAVLVTSVSSPAGPVAGASVSFLIDAIPPGAGVPAEVEEDLASTGTSGSGVLSFSFAAGSSSATNVSDASGQCGATTIKAGAGYGVMRITATATKGSQTATATAYLRVQRAGALYSFGKGNCYGALGNGNKSCAQSVPATVSYFAKDIIDIQLARTAEGGTLLNRAGEIYTWGYGCYGLNGQFNSGNSKSYFVPTKVPSPITYKSLASGYYSVGAVSSTGGAYAWGKNYAYVTVATRPLNEAITTPTLIHPSLSSGVKQLSLSQYNGLALKEDGTVWTWGYNYCGYGLGIGSTKAEYVTTPTKLNFPGAGRMVYVCAGWASGFAIDEAGNIWSWGDGSYYRLGTGNCTNQRTPVKLTIGGGFTRINHFPSPGGSVLAIKGDGNAFFWGNNPCGNAGNGNCNTVKTPTNIGLTNVANGVAGPTSTHIVRKDGTVWSAGNGCYGQLGAGNTKSVKTWVKALMPANNARLVANNEHTTFVLTNG
ncbi:RCC1 domain-containing protein [Klugiella xanthotipulae]|uniref:RCC1 domain-containing protein n=1 Tax=Klugiella xanthotipulae TaxID=244735 RepID=UPI001477375D|nr:RCC1 domain-containing protein [Klugiella xanthotipulae]